jgi:uncharacterized membrane protein
MTDPKAKAQEIVDNYFNILFDDGDVNEIAICKHYAIACAISEVEGRIETLVEFNKIIPISIKAAVEQLDAVLTELKNMN